jgi:hypothetical protein
VSFATGERVQIEIARGWVGEKFIARSGWRAARVLATKRSIVQTMTGPREIEWVTAVTRDGIVWQHCNPVCVRRVSK